MVIGTLEGDFIHCSNFGAKHLPLESEKLYGMSNFHFDKEAKVELIKEKILSSRIDLESPDIEDLLISEILTNTERLPSEMAP